MLVAHPRLTAAATRHGITLEVGAVKVVEPLGYVEMLQLVSRAKGVITDSGGLQKEAYLLGTPCTTVRSETEWPETLTGGMNVLNPELENLGELIARVAKLPDTQPFGDGHAAKRIVGVLSHATNRGHK